MKRQVVTALIACAASFSTAATAQDEAQTQTVPDDVQTAIIYGDDDAPPCPSDRVCVIVVLAEGERYRIPPDLRVSSDPANTAWARRVERLEMIGDFGALSCSTAGAGGFTGCTQQLLEQAYGEKREGAEVRFSELINAARQERLDRIDDEAAEEQARVEAIEREYLERLEAERNATLPDEQEGAEAEALPDPNTE